jgi:RHS repeat-associated protein
MTPESATGPYDLVWTWYDGAGRRFMTHLATTEDRGSLARPDSTAGFRTYYVYDGSDVAFTLVRPSTGTTWRIQQRYVNTGLDENVAARLWLNGTPTSLALVTDRQGGYIMGVKANGLEETSTGFYLRNAFGKLESGSTAASSMETHTGLGFTGAGTPTSAGGGYVYLRNRWYDPQTGRFLSQDPIGLAGGVNLYAYAGNNPASYSDPFGLCKRPKGKGIGICVEGYIKTKFFGLGDNRGAQSNGGTYKTSMRFSIDPKTGIIRGIEHDIGSTHGHKGFGGTDVSPAKSDGHGGWNVTTSASAVNGTGYGPMIDYSVTLNVSKDGKVTVAGGNLDGFPSVEVWSYDKAGKATNVMDYDGGNPMPGALKLFDGYGDVPLPQEAQK